MEEHKDHLQRVFKKLKENQLYVKREKCFFAQRINFLGHVVEYDRIGAQRINFLGHVVEYDRIGVEEGRIVVVHDWRIPKSVTDLHSFLGLANYYSRFVEGFFKRASVD